MYPEAVCSPAFSEEVLSERSVWDRVGTAGMRVFHLVTEGPDLLAVNPCCLTEPERLHSTSASLPKYRFVARPVIHRFQFSDVNWGPGRKGSLFSSSGLGKSSQQYGPVLPRQVI